MFYFAVGLLEAVYEMSQELWAQRVAEEPFENHSDIVDICEEAWDLLESLYECEKAYDLLESTYQSEGV